MVVARLDGQTAAINPDDASAWIIRDAEPGHIKRPAEVLAWFFKGVSAKEPPRDKMKKREFFYK